MDYYQLLDEYIMERNQFGYSLKRAPTLLKKFIQYAYENNHVPFTNEGFMNWKRDYGSASEGTWKKRLSVYRGFAIWLKHIEPLTEVPPSCLIPSSGFSRTKPYIYSDDEISQILTEARRLRSSHGLKGLAYSTLFGLLRTTGMRIGEVTNLTIQDVNLNDLVIHIRNAKNNRERVIPITEGAAMVLEEYDRMVEKYVPKDHSHFFVLEDARPIHTYNAQYNFAQIGQKIGLRKKQQLWKLGKGPRIHDLRHTFAVKTLISAFENNLDVDVEIYKLSNFLGHEKIEYTYWYIEAVPELMTLAAQRLEDLIGGDEND